MELLVSILAIHVNFRFMVNNIWIKLACCFYGCISIAGCARLDDSFFNPNHTKITAYKLDSYTGETDFRLDASYKIDDSLVHLFTLNSQAPGENSPTKIYALYIGHMARIATDTVIMYCHGNKDHMDFYWPRAELLANTNGKNNYGVMMEMASTARAVAIKRFDIRKISAEYEMVLRKLVNSDNINPIREVNV